MTSSPAISVRTAMMRVLATALLYAVAARLSLFFAIPPGYATAVWPPAGIALALAILWGRPAAAGVFLGSLAANAWLGWERGPFFSAVLAAAGIGLASALQAGIGARLLQRFLGRSLALVEARDILLFPPLVGAGCLVSASLSVAWLTACGAMTPAAAPLNWFTWWVGDAAGVLVLAPVVFTLAGKPDRVWRRRRWTVGMPLAASGMLAVLVFRWLATDSNRAGVLIGGFFAASLLGAFLLALTGRTHLIEEEVVRRTAQLTELNAALAARGAQETKAKEEVRALNRDLSRRVADRTSELEAARAEAEAANQAKSAFLANMSHEVRTPMNGILGLTEVLRASELSAKQREWLEALGDSADSLMRLLNDILDLSKVEAGEMALELAPFSPRHEAEAAVRLLAERARQKGLVLHQEVAPQVPALLVGDGFRFRQVLLNLAGNAVKFTDSGSVLVRVEAAPAAADTVTLRVDVADTGPGIPPDKLERIFNPFAQCDSSIARRFGGSGLGLSICRRITALMGGRVWAENRAGGGTVFHATMALGTAADCPAGPCAPDKVPPCPPAPPNSL